MNKFKSAFIGTLLLLAFVFSAQTFASQQPGKVDICHATASNTNPYVSESPNIQNNGTLSGGHLNHTGPVWHLGITTSWGDIIPPYSYGNFHYSGMNWTSVGQTIFNNGCNTPTPTSTPTPTKAPTATPTMTPTPTRTVSPTPTPKKDDCDDEDHDNFRFDNNYDHHHDDDKCPSTTPTATPTPEPSVTPVVTPTDVPNPGGPGDGLGCATHDCSSHPAPSTPTQAVLGASTSVLGLSNTGSGDAGQKEAALFIASLALLAAGSVILRKNA